MAGLTSKAALCAMVLWLCLPASASALQLSEFSQAEAISLGKVPVRVRPVREYVASAVTAGTLELTLPYNTREIKVGTVFAQLDLDRIQLEQRLLELSERRLHEKELTEWQLSNQRNIEQIKQEISRIQSENALLNRLKADPEVSAVFLEGEETSLPDGASSAETVEAMLAENAERLVLLRSFEKLIQSEPYEELEREFQLTKLEQQKLNLEQRMELSRMDAPFGGSFQYLIPQPTGDVQEIRVRTGDDVARIRDMSELVAELAVTNETWRGYPSARLQLRIGQGFGQVLANFDTSSVQQVGGKEQLIFSFLVEPVYNTRATGLIGGVVNGQLYLQLNQEAVLVPKLSILTGSVEAFRSGGWRAAVADAFPGHELVAVGESAIAVSAKPGN